MSARFVTMPSRNCLIAAGLAVVSLIGAPGAQSAASSDLEAARATLARAARPLPVPERARLIAVSRAGARLVAVGEQGTVILSDDSGKRWRAAASVATSASLTQVRFADAQSGWATGHYGVVLRTRDGGEHWERVLDGEKSAQAAVAAAQASGNPQRMRAAQLLKEDGPDKPFLDLRFEGPSSVTVVGAYNTAFRTDDGGASWREESVGSANAKSLHLYGLARIGNTDLWVGEAGLIVRRDVSGTAFDRLPAPFPGTFNGILALNESEALIYGLRGKVYRTADRGTTWQSANVPGDSAITSAHLMSRGRIALGDQSGRILLSQDGGQTFRAVNRGGVPISGLAEAPDGGLVATTLIGISLFAPNLLEQEQR